MGLKTWKQGPDEKNLKGDVSIAKNYLNKKFDDSDSRVHAKGSQADCSVKPEFSTGNF